MSSGFNTIRKHARDKTSIRIKDLAQQFATAASRASGSQLETDDIRSQGRMVHSTIKLNDERLKFITTLSSSNTDFYYEFPTEPDFNHLKVWFMLDHLGARMRDMSGFGNDAIITGHPTLRRASLNLGFQQTSASFGTPAMLFNSGTDVVSKTDGEYIWIPDNPSIQFTNPSHSAGFSVALRFNCLDFERHEPIGGGLTVRRIAAKTDTNLTGHDVTTATNGWNLVCSNNGVNNGLVFQVIHNGVEYQKRAGGFNTNAWYQVICTYNPNVTASDRIKIYVGANLTGSTSTTTLFLPLHPNLRIGSRDSSSGFFYGYIHDFRLYMNKVLTQSEITNLNDNEITIDNIPKSHVFVVQYALVQQTQRSKRHVYDMDGRIKRSRKHRYNIIVKITSNHTHKWDRVIAVSKSKTHKFHVTNLVQRLRTHVYDMAGTITTTRTHKYNIVKKLTTTRTHKYNIGGLQTQYQRFQKSTTVGSNITQEITFTSTPQALIVWSDNSTADNTLASILYTFYGFSDGTHHACVSGICRDSQDPTDTFSGHKDDKVISMMDNNSGTVSAEATVSFSANKAIFNWTTNDARASYIHCMALWGLNNAEVKTFATGTSSSGNAVYSLNNTSMTPTFIHTLSRAGNLDWTTGTAYSISLGAAVSSARQFSVSNVSEDGATTTDTHTAYSTTNCIVQLDDDSGSEETAGSLNSFGTGTFTISWNNAPASSQRVFSVLALDAPTLDVGLITQPNNVTGNQVISTAANVNAVRGVMVFTNGQTTTGPTSTHLRLSVGGGSGTTASEQGVTSVAENDSAADSETVKIQKSGAIVKVVTAASSAGSSTTDTEASLNALGTDQFTLNWSVIDSTLRKYHYIAFGT